MNLQVGVKILIRNKSDKYLFIKRKKLLQNETEQSWDIPGGRIKPGETLMKALQREVNEEINVTLTGEPQLINAQDIFVPTKKFHVVRLTYIIDLDIDSVKLSDAHGELMWATLPNTSSFNIEPFLKETLDKIS